MKETISKLSNERLEAEIANQYYRAYEEGIKVVEKEGSLLSMLWAEWEERYHDGRINDEDYWTGNEVDFD